MPKLFGVRKRLQDHRDLDTSDAKSHAAGTIFIAPNGDILLLHRGGIEGQDNFVGHWALPGGGVDAGETPEEGAAREDREEMGGSAPKGRKKLLDCVLTPSGGAFHTFIQPVEAKFAPKLNDEHTGFTWANMGRLPGPMHPAVLKTLETRVGIDKDVPPDAAAQAGQELAEWAGEETTPEDTAMAQDAVLAFDRAPDGMEISRHGVIVVEMAFDRDTGQGHRVDDFDRLHVKRVPITKATVSPYYGREIPKGKELGLDPNKIYKLLRDPDEIKKGAASSHNVPLLSQHVPHSADEHDGDITVGTVGSESDYEHPYLYNSLAVWSREGRDYVDNKSQKELSSAYSYDADMTPGSYEGEDYHGVMRNMRWNHVCMVKKGRAGSDVALDEALKPPTETILMTKRIMSLKAGVAYGAVRNMLRGVKLAQDAAIDLGPAFAAVKPKKFTASKGKLVSNIRSALKGKLAQDADLAGVIENVAELIEALDIDKTVEDSDIDDTGSTDLDDDTSMDGDNAAIIAYLKSKGVADDVIAGLPKGEADEVTEDADIEGETPEEKAERLKKAALAKDGVEPPDTTGAGGKTKPDFVSKGAMDAALQNVRAETIRQMNAVSDAKEHVRPVVGELKMAFDSAEGVYRQGFKMQGRDVSDIKELSALKAMWDMIPTGKRAEPALAMDSATVADFGKDFPNMSKVKRA